MSGEMDATIARLSRDGWDAFEGLDGRMEKDAADFRDKAMREAQIVAKALDSAAGALFLQWLINITLLRAPSDLEASAATIEDYALRKARREGQNGVTFAILAALKHANGQQANGGLS